MPRRKCLPFIRELLSEHIVSLCEAIFAALFTYRWRSQLAAIAEADIADAFRYVIINSRRATLYCLANDFQP